MLLPDQTYEQAIRHANFLASFDTIRRLLESKELRTEKQQSTKNSPHNTIKHNDLYKKEILNKYVERKPVHTEVESIHTERTKNNKINMVDDDTTEFLRTSNFFNNIPDYLGETLRPFLEVDDKNVQQQQQEINNNYDVFPTSPDILRECELFLWKHRIRSDFFCKYRRAMNISQSAPSSMPLSPVSQDKIESMVKSKPNSVTFSSNNQRSSTRSIHRFQKSSAIYTLPTRGKRRRRCARSSTDFNSAPLSNADASSSNEAVHLQQRLKSLSTELVTLRNRLHVGQTGTVAGVTPMTVVNTNVTSVNGPTIGNTSVGVANGQLNGVMGGGNNGQIVTINSNGTTTTIATTNSNHVGVTPPNKVHAMNGCIAQVNGLMPIVSPRNTSIPHPLPHHINGTSGSGSGIVVNCNNAPELLPCNGTLPRRSTSGNNIMLGGNMNNNNNSIGLGGSNVNIMDIQNKTGILLSTNSITNSNTTLSQMNGTITSPLQNGTHQNNNNNTSNNSNIIINKTTNNNNNHNNNNIINNNINNDNNNMRNNNCINSNTNINNSNTNIINNNNNNMINNMMNSNNNNNNNMMNNNHNSNDNNKEDNCNNNNNNMHNSNTNNNNMHNSNDNNNNTSNNGYNINSGIVGGIHTTNNGSNSKHNYNHPINHNINNNNNTSNNNNINNNNINNHQISQQINIIPTKLNQSIKPPTAMDDLIHLPGPLTEDAVMRTLHARFADTKNFTNVGPILLSINPYQDVGNPLTLSSTRSLPLAPQLRRIVQEAVRQQAETGYPQAIILSGTSGSGKTHCSMLLLRQLFAVAGGGPETDAFKHLAAAFTVLRSLGSAKTATNSESSRIGQFIEVQVTDGALYRTKIHCYFLDQTRVIRPLHNEKNYHIFYQMLAGLNREERIKLNLEGYSPTNLRYLQGGDTRQDEHEDAARFQAWKACLGILGIPFLDVVRVLAAVLLLGNVQFVDGQGLEVDVKGEPELNAVASLLGVPSSALFRGLTTRTHNARGQLIKSVCDANMSNMTRDSLAKALYCRTVATIVRRANSLKRLGSTLGTLSSDSNESVHNQVDVVSQHASTIGGNSGSKSMAALNNAVRHATDGFIGILDMFGFEEPRPAQLEHLCINLCAETMQHFYNTHIFKSSVESCRDEGIICDTEVDYVDNVPCIDLISSLRTGLLSMLDAECSVRGTAESYVAKIKVQHRNSVRLETKATEPHDPRIFAIRHFAGRVEYDATDFLDTNRDVVPDDLVAVFYKHTCNFGFATHLFGSELKALYAMEHVPRGLSFRIAPTSHTDLLNGDEPVSTLTQDFHTRLDNLLRTLVHARPHFVRCIRSNATETPGRFDRMTVVRQIRALQVLETVNLMASGFPHRMRFKQFTGRYRMLAPFRLLRRCEEKALEDCKLILQYALENPPELDGSVTLSWAPGKRHIFLSEGIRQHLEKLRSDIRMRSATVIQSTWRGWQLRRRIGTVRKSNREHLITSSHATASPATRQSLSATPAAMGKSTGNISANQLSTNNAATTRPRPQPIAGTPPPDPSEKCDSKIIQQTCTLFGLDLERPPPVPPSRSYTVTGNSKLGYPQTRIMKMNFPEDSSTNTVNEKLRKGDAVTVVGASHRRGHLIVEHNSISLHVPFQYMELVKNTTAPSVNI